MEIGETRVGASLVIRVSGRLDATNSSQLEKFVSERVQGGANRIVFDFSALHYISSAGLRVLAATAKQLSAVDGRIALCNLQRPVQTILEVSGISSCLSIASSLDDAVGSVALPARETKA